MIQKNISIHFLLKISLIAILMGSSILGLISLGYHQALWKKYDTLYNHPLMVQRSIDEIKLALLNIQVIEKDTYFDDSSSPELSYHKIEDLENSIEKHFLVLKDRYLGPREDVELAYQDFRKFKQEHRTFHEEITQGNRRQVQEAFILHIAGHKAFYEKLQTISVFSAQKGDSLYHEGSKSIRAFKTQLILLILIVILSSWLLILFLMRSIKDPLSQMLPFLAQAKSTHFQSRLPDLGKNEFGSLALAMNHLAETIDFDIQKQTLLEQLTDTLISTDDLSIFCKQLLQILIEQSHAKAGAIYVLNEDKESFALQASVGLNLENYKEFDASSHHGIFGLSLMSKKMEEIVPCSEHVLINMRYLEFDLLPKKILTIPIMTSQHVIALISLSSLDGFNELGMQAIKDSSELISARMISMLAFDKIKLFNQQLETQNQEIEEQKNELSQQAQELQLQNTTLVAQKEKLLELNQMKSSFLSNMSHELRTPLNSIIALSGVLHKRCSESDHAEEQKFLKVIEKNGKHLLALINDILSLSKLESGKEVVHPSRIDLNDLLSELKATLQAQAEEKNIILDIDAPENYFLLTDLAKCRQILLNLIGNAIKFTEQGNIRVFAENKGKLCFLHVEDTGIGISAEQLPHIFDEFYQADQSFSRKHEGTGLGLSIAKKYAEMLGGTIQVESAPGKGSRFTLLLPDLDHKILEAQSALLPSHKKGSISLADKQKKKILIIEDSDPAIIQLNYILQNEGYQVFTARNGKEGLEEVSKHSPDGIILDLMMPEMDGFEVLKTLRSRPEDQHLPVLIVTAKHISKEELSFLQGNHIHQLIQKGDISKYELLSAIEAMIFSIKLSEDKKL